jgi:hypothetical protein
MASGRNSNNSDGGWIGALIVLAIVLMIVVAFLSLVGHALGLTPSAGDVLGDRPDGWVKRHYENLGWGYVLTVVVLVAGVAWLVAAAAAFSNDAKSYEARKWLASISFCAVVLTSIVVGAPYVGIGIEVVVVIAEDSDGAGVLGAVAAAA